MNPDTFIIVQQVLAADHQAIVTGIALQVDSPTVFLFDEYHLFNALIDDNVAIAKTLIQIAGVMLIGVEGCAGDRITVHDIMVPVFERCFGRGMRFTSAMLACPEMEVVGVDSPELSRRIDEDCQQGKWAPQNHPAQELRSEHMVTTIIQKFQTRGNAKAAILNAGARHNDDIQTIVVGAKRNQVGADIVSFVRVRSRLFPKL